MVETLLDEIKIRLNITGEYHDRLLMAYADDVKCFMMSGGVPRFICDSPHSYGVIARGVADLWNYGSGNGKFSDVFFQRVIQLATPGATEEHNFIPVVDYEYVPISDEEINEMLGITEDEPEDNPGDLDPPEGSEYVAITEEEIDSMF